MANNETNEQKRLSRECLGKYFYDLSKLAFGGLAIGGVLTLQDAPQNVYFVITGVLATVIFAVIGSNIIKQKI